MATKKDSAESRETKEKPYEKLLQRAIELRGKVGELAFDRIEVLQKVFDDRQWRKDQGNVDDAIMAKALDEYVEDLALPFLALRTMLEHFPNRERWADGKLRSMYEQMIKERGAPERQIIPRRRASVEDLEKTKQELGEWKLKATDLELKLSVAQKRILELETENAQLREQAPRKAA